MSGPKLSRSAKKRLKEQSTSPPENQNFLSEGIIKAKARSMNYYLADYFVNAAVGQPRGPKGQLEGYIQTWGCPLPQKRNYLSQLPQLINRANEMAKNSEAKKRASAAEGGNPVDKESKSIGRLRAHADYTVEVDETPPEEEKKVVEEALEEAEPAEEHSPENKNSSGIPGL
jgi:hypothetical protein